MALQEDHIFEVNIDGASRGNPGPSGAGVVIMIPGGGSREISEYLGERTNNQAEYEALLVALRELKTLGARRVRFYSDSELLVKQLRAEYRIRNEGLKSLIGSVLTMLSSLDHCEFALINRKLNTRADRLANFAIDKEESLRMKGSS